jgi:prephenate dehydratase
MQVGYLGPKGSYSYLAAQTLTKQQTLVPYQSFSSLVQALTDGAVDQIVLPIENTLNGGVLQNLDLLQSTSGIIAVAACTLKIDHRLFTQKGANLSQITTVYSHGQALDQCARYLAANLPKARLVPTQSTSGSLEQVTTLHDAAIAGSHLTPAGLQMSSTSISDEPNNFTHFLLVVRGEADKTKASSRVYFSFVCTHQVGALLHVLNIVASNNLNMTKIESRPIKNKPGEYRFFVEADGNYQKQEVRQALQAVQSAVSSFKLLGTY